MFLKNPVGDLVEDGAQVRLARAGNNHEIIRDRGNFTHVQHDNVFRLFVVREIAAELSQFF